MTTLADIPQEKHQDLIALPYRVGMWISFSDLDGGDAAEESELHACENMIAAYVEDFCKSEFVQDLMVQTLKQRHEWDIWKTDLNKVPEECAETLNYLRTTIGDAETSAFVDNLIEIGFSVALAYRESEPVMSLKDKLSKFGRVVRERLSARPIEISPYAEYSNVSKKEWASLQILAEALGKPIAKEAVPK